MSCKCQGCGKQYNIDVNVPDDVWEIIKPAGKQEGAGLLCGSCILEKLEKLDYKYHFLGRVNKAGDQ